MADSGAVTPARPLVTVFGKQAVHVQPYYLYMGTTSTGCVSTEALFYDKEGQLVYRVLSRGWFFEEKTVLDAQGAVLCTAKKLPLSLAKWTLRGPDGAIVGRTRSVPGLVKYGVEVLVGRSSKPFLLATPDLSLRSVNVRQLNGKGDPEVPMLTAAYGSNVVLGFVSALVQDWSFHICLEPGADAVLACVLLAIYDELVEWNAVGGMFGMMT